MMNKKEKPVFTVFYTNLGFSSNENFETAKDALRYAQSKGFDAHIRRDGYTIASWSPLYGLFGSLAAPKGKRRKGKRS